MTKLKKGFLFSIPAIIFWAMVVFNTTSLLIQFLVIPKSDPVGLVLINTILLSFLWGSILLVLNFIFSFKIKILFKNENTPIGRFLYNLGRFTNWAFLIFSIVIISLFGVLGGFSLK